MDARHGASAAAMRTRLANGPVPPSEVRAALAELPPGDRDTWLDRVLALDDLPDDGPALPRGCVPYLPCSVNAILSVIDGAGVGANDVFVDVGAGVGRAAALVHLVTGASTIGLEIQPALVDASRDLTSRVSALRFAPVAGDATVLTAYMMIGSVFFLYCPFSGARLERVLDDLEEIARTRPIRVCSVDLPLPPRPWLAPLSTPSPSRSPSPSNEVAVYRSVQR